MKTTTTQLVGIKAAEGAPGNHVQQHARDDAGNYLTAESDDKLRE